MNWLQFAFSFVELLAALVEWCRKQQWYQQGYDDAVAAGKVQEQSLAAQAAKLRAAANAANADNSVHDHWRD